MSPRLYLETSMISYLVGRQSRDAITRGNQELTRQWWETRRFEYELYVSELVVREAEIGELGAARIAIIEPLSILSVPEEAELLAPTIMRAAGLASNAVTDALHIALAAVHGMHYLVTWNCKHIANAVIRRAVERQCRLGGYEPPVICTT